MRKLRFTTGLLSILFSLFFSGQTFSQTTLEVDPEVEQLLAIKKDMNAPLAINSGYKIQIYTGSSSLCERTRTGFKREFEEYDSTIVYSNPNYKVYVGPFESRLEAENALQKIKEEYPLALLIKP